MREAFRRGLLPPSTGFHSKLGMLHVRQAWGPQVKGKDRKNRPVGTETRPQSRESSRGPSS